MNPYIITKTILRVSLIAIVFSIVSSPSPTFAATKKPTCVLTVHTSIGTTTIQGKGEVLLQKESKLGISWNSTHATKAVNGRGKTISVDGSITSSPKKNSTYSYTFSNGSKKTTCAVSATLVTGTFATSTLTTNSSKPTVSGKVSGIEKVQIQIWSEGSTTPLYTSEVIKVRQGTWKAKISDKIPNGTYTVNLLGVRSRALNTFVSGTLRIGKSAVSQSDTAQGTLVVQPVPLLLGGVAHAGESVAVSYLQVINIGKNPVTIHGFNVVQTGNASAEAIAGLTVVDDTGSLGGSMGGIDGKTPFKNGQARIPIDAIFEAGQMRLFTIKVVLGDIVTPYVGTQLKIHVIGVDTTAKVQSTLPIRGVVWNIES